MKLLLCGRRAAQAIACLVFLIIFQVADAATQPGRVVITGIQGTAEYQIRGAVVWHQLKVGMVLAEGVSFRTGKTSLVDLAFTTGAIARMTGRTVVSLDRLTEETSGLPQLGKRPIGRTEMTLHRGRLMTEVAKQMPGSIFRVHTPEGDINVKGTQVTIAYDPESGQFALIVYEGVVTLTLANGQIITVNAGQQITGTYSATGITVTAPTSASEDPDFKHWLDSSETIRKVVTMGEGPVDLNAVIQAANVPPLTGPNTGVIPNITNPTIVSPSQPAAF